MEKANIIIQSLIIALLVFGPDELVNTAKKVGKTLNRFFKSDYWKNIIETRQEIVNFTKDIVEEAKISDAALQVSEFEEMTKKGYVDLKKGSKPVDKEDQKEFEPAEEEQKDSEE